VLDRVVRREVVHERWASPPHGGNHNRWPSEPDFVVERLVEFVGRA
jgi:hypothetical protein